MVYQLDKNEIIKKFLNGAVKLLNYTVCEVSQQDEFYVENFLFAMNGQTGKFVGNLPVDKGAALKYFAISSAIFTAIFAILELIFRI